MMEKLGLPESEGLKKRRSCYRKKTQGGSEILEFTLVLLPALGFLFLVLNVAWTVYSRSTLQYAVAQGVRYAVTSQTMPSMGAIASIQTVVQNSAFGRLRTTSGAATGVNGWNNIYVDWYLIDSTTGALIPQNGIVGGNGMQKDGELPLVRVSVQSVSTRNLLPTIRMPGLTTLTPVVMTAESWDRMETPPISGGGFVIPAQ